MNFHELSNLVENNRYSVEVNYRTNMDEVLDGFSKMLLGFVSAAMKTAGYHVKKLFDEEPYRILISSRNWQEGEWVIVVSYNPDQNKFYMSKGFYNKMSKSVTIQATTELQGKSAAEIYRDIFNHMGQLKNAKPHHIGDLKGVKAQTGPVQGSRRPGQGLMNKGRPQGQAFQGT